MITVHKLIMNLIHVSTIDVLKVLKFELFEFENEIDKISFYKIFGK